MTLPASGAISLAQVNLELNWPSTRVISLNDLDVRQIAKVLTGVVSFTSLQGKTRNPGALGSGTGPANYYSTATTTYWQWSSNFQTLTILQGGTTLYSQQFVPSTTDVIVSGSRTYYRGAFQSGGGLSPSLYAFFFVDG